MLAFVRNFIFVSFQVSKLYLYCPKYQFSGSSTSDLVDNVFLTIIVSAYLYLCLEALKLAVETRQIN